MTDPSLPTGLQPRLQARLQTDRVRVGMVGTGFVARLRAAALQTIPHARLVAVAGHGATETESFAQAYGAVAVESRSA